jgi:hypothetical protein
MAENDKKVDVVLKTWDQLQSIVRTLEDSATKMRAAGFAVWGALLAYAYTNHGALVFLTGLLSITFSCANEIRIRQIQFAFIRRSLELEKALGAFMVNDVQSFIAADVSTRIPSPSFRQFRDMFGRRRWAIWSPYAFAMLVSAVAWLLDSLVSKQS